MKVKSIKLTNFKRFDNLTINLGENSYKLVILVGPNGCGKSSIFDSFEQIGGRNKNNFQEDNNYLQKKQNEPWDVLIDTDNGSFTKKQRPPQKFCYLRSAYRIEADVVNVSIQKKEEVLLDSLRPKRMIDEDRKVKDNYERLISDTVMGVYSKEKDSMLVKDLREELIDKLRKSMKNVFPDLLFKDIGNPLREGQFYFNKGLIENFPYKNLSSGEKGAFDILFDLIIKTKEFNDSIIAIDEPDLHMHSSLQRSLLKEIYEIMPDSCQLWIATHSIGFIRAACELARKDSDRVALLDFSNKDFDLCQVLMPEILTADKIQKIFETAIEDLAYMVYPGTVIICEGSSQSGVSEGKKELDAKIYSKIFYDQEVLFVSGENKTTVQKSGAILSNIVKNAGSLRKIIALVDKDNIPKEKIEEFQNKSPEQKFLRRREIENYLFDDEILKKYCESKNLNFSEITCKFNDIINDDAKEKQSAIRNQCAFDGSVEEFKLILASFITPDTNIYAELKECVGLN